MNTPTTAAPATESRATGSHAADRLAALIDAAGAPACVGLDPVYDKLPGALRCGTGGLTGLNAAATGPLSAIARFCAGVLEACRGVVPVIKPQSACFERYGPEGVAVLAQVCSLARDMGFFVLLDAKRGDIGVTAEHYAAMAFDAMRADAVTLSGFMGPDTIEPFLKHAGTGRMVFVLVRTSNPGSDTLQSLALADGRTVAEATADMVASIGQPRLGTSGLSNVGAVVAATKPQDGPALRARMPNSIFLIPGYGAQGGSAADIRGMIRPKSASAGTAGVLVTASRSVIYAGSSGDGDWQGAVNHAAKSLVAELAPLTR
ncbi:MAG: orotidine-5'-phosphate decarboxylase [Phycisphaerales bacterium]|jgi:orotidine-5'-phosphate decarboxylase|nr:orotidine-5'-phosphate decarboxylase [Phycisphaeraceae bacterium]